MVGLRLGPLVDDKPVRITLDLPASLHRDLVAYVAAHAEATGQAPVPAQKIIAAMLANFMDNDRAFMAVRRSPTSR
ncbi:MAG: hypothetical protein JWR80_4240 [Bradyrhizobium sp.]|nr:hypothetical protein [Bradyrhizobium sp.]